MRRLLAVISLGKQVADLLGGKGGSLQGRTDFALAFGTVAPGASFSSLLNLPVTCHSFSSATTPQ